MTGISLSIVLIVFLVLLILFRINISKIAGRALRIILIVYFLFIITSSSLLMRDTIVSNSFLKDLYIIKEETIDSIDNIMSPNYSGVIYFYHEDCIYCKEIEEPLNEYAKKKPMIITKFNTKRYKDTQSYEANKRILDFVSIEEVPALVYIQDGKVDKISYFGEMAELTNYEYEQNSNVDNIFEINDKSE